MKKVLSLLMAFVFLQAETWALSGGPFDGANGINSTIGSYAGILVGTIPPGGVGPVGGAGLGIFTIGLPEGGIGTGIFAVYSGGASIGGDVIGIGDPGEQTITGVMSGTFIPNVDTGGGVVFGGVVTQLGAQLNLKIEGGRRGVSTVGTRVKGTAGATITYYDFPATIVVATDFVVTGYKQSGDSTLATSIDLPAAFSGSGG